MNFKQVYNCGIKIEDAVNIGLLDGNERKPQTETTYRGESNNAKETR
jgi:hypothetical protein